MQDAPLAARRVAGFRVLRSLARDEDAEVLLGFREWAAESSAPADVVTPAPVTAAPVTTVALKTMAANPNAWAQTVGALEALERARGEHVVDVLDVDCTDELVCVVFERLPNGSLADLLALRERLDAGEVVTIVAPLAAALERMHLAGVGHGAVGARTVMFRADGAPVLIGFGSSSVFAPGSPEVVLEAEPTVVADRRALRELACLLLSRVVGSRARAARGLVTELESCPEPVLLETLGRRLFEVAAAVPVRFTVDEDSPGDAPPARVVPIAPPVESGAEPRASSIGVLARLIPEPWVQRVLDTVDGSPLAPAAAATLAIWRRWTPARRRVVLGVGVVVVVLGVALTAIPTAPPASADPAGRSAGSPSASEPRGDASSDPSAAAGSSSAGAGAAAGDDPLAAAGALIAAREKCLRSLSQLCLEGVDQPDSGALRDDRETIRIAQQGGELPRPLVDAETRLAPELVERLGDSALVRLAEAASATPTTAPTIAPTMTPSARREPASLLLVKGEAGWRIRDLIVAPSGGPTG